MIYLILAMVSSMLVSVLMRVSGGRSKNNISMLAVNYFMCTLMAVLFSGSSDFFPAQQGLAVTLGLGAISGVMYLASFMLLQWNISRNGVVLPATFMKLGVLVPTLMSILVFGESPRLLQVIGFIAAIAAIFLIQGDGKKEAGSVLGLVILLIGGGSTDAMSKIFEEVGPAALKDHYLLYTFAMALVLCIALSLFKKQRLCPADVLFGLLIGIPNYLSSRFLLLSLGQVPAVVAYPSYSVGTIVLVSVIGVLVFKEKLSRRKLVALGIILAALVMLNL